MLAETPITARPQSTAHHTSLLVSTRFHSSTSAADALPPLDLGGRRRCRIAMARHGFTRDQREVDDRRAEDGAERDEEADLAPRIVRTEEADLAQPGREREADQADHDRRHADARADDHAGAEIRRGER